MGHSGWIGYEMFCMYSDMMVRRTSSIMTHSRNSRISSSNHFPSAGTGPGRSHVAVEDIREQDASLEESRD